MTTTVRETNRFALIEATQMGTTLIQDKHTGRETLWNTGIEAEEEKTHLLGLNDEDFDEYCEMKTVSFIE